MNPLAQILILDFLVVMLGFGLAYEFDKQAKKNIPYIVKNYMPKFSISIVMSIIIGFSLVQIKSNVNYIENSKNIKIETRSKVQVIEELKTKTLETKPYPKTIKQEKIIKGLSKVKNIASNKF